MKHITVKTGLTTVTFRKMDIPAIVALAETAGLDGLEIGGDVHVPPGDLTAAKLARLQAENNGLEILSYGSYFIAGESDLEAFHEVLRTAAALGTKTVRIWTGKRNQNSDSEYKKFISELKTVCRMADELNIELGLEFHNGTQNDTAQNALRIIADTGEKNIFSYWQPLYRKAQNLADIAALSDAFKYVHVYNWIYNGNQVERLALSDNPGDWRAYVAALKQKTYIMEFVKDDDTHQFFADAAFLHKLIKETLK